MRSTGGSVLGVWGAHEEDIENGTEVYAIQVPQEGVQSGLGLYTPVPLVARRAPELPELLVGDVPLRP